ncbi:MAG: hypothetical protein Q8Q35_02420 [Nanoarchaeota archaeon]|nr:hypothetical protein [Nanoarchaeota archaeon]
MAGKTSLNLKLALAESIDKRINNVPVVIKIDSVYPTEEYCPGLKEVYNAFFDLFGKLYK